MATKVPTIAKVPMAAKTPVATKHPMPTKVPIETKCTNRTKCNTRGLASYVILALFDKTLSFFQLNVFWWRWGSSSRILRRSHAKKGQGPTKNEKNQLQISDSSRGCALPNPPDSRRFSSHFASRLTNVGTVMEFRVWAHWLRLK